MHRAITARASCVDAIDGPDRPSVIQASEQNESEVRARSWMEWVVTCCDWKYKREEEGLGRKL